MVSMGSQESFRVVRGLSGFLVSVQWKRASSPVQAGTSWFLSCSDVDLGVFLKFQMGSQVSTVFRHGTLLFSPAVKEVSGLQSS